MNVKLYIKNIKITHFDELKKVPERQQIQLGLVRAHKDTWPSLLEFLDRSFDVQ